MRYTPEIEERLVAQIESAPTKALVLPDWAYWEGGDVPWIYMDGEPTPLPRHLHGVIIRALPDHVGLRNPPEVHARNVNPYLMVVTPTRKSEVACPKGHRYTADDYRPGRGNRCGQCRAEKLLGTPSPIDINRAKTVCPQGHDLVKRPNGRRRCLECPRAQQAAYRARKQGT